MRIGIDAFPLVQMHGGVGNYVRHLLSTLAALGTSEEFVAYVPKHILSREDIRGMSRLHDVRWVETARSGLRWRGRLDRLDVYHGTNYRVQARGRHGAVLSIHDLWLDRYPQYSKKFLGQRLSFYRTRRRAWRANRVIVGSHHAAGEVQALYGLPANRISVIHYGVSPEFYPEHDPFKFSSLRERLGIPDGPYILFIGGADPRKNHRALFQALATHAHLHRSFYVVAVGAPSHRSGSLTDTAQALGINSRLRCLGSVSVSDLRLLYSHAHLFVFPSWYEGFGFPVLEAMACGAPVVTSNRTSLPEVAGDAAMIVDPEDAEGLADAMLRVLDQSALQQSLKEKGFARAKEFSWKKTAEQTLQVYHQVCSRR